MGLFFSSLFGSLFGRKEVRILILGLDNAGKTTILYRLQVDDPITTVPTIGFNVETLQYKNIKFQVWDLGGQTSIRPYWRCYYPNTDAIIFVVDSCDKDRIGVARAELAAMLEEEDLRDSILLVFANKQDLPGAMTAEEVSRGLGLAGIRGRQWSIQETSAVNGTGLFEGFDWLVACIKGGAPPAEEAKNAAAMSGGAAGDFAGLFQNGGKGVPSLGIQPYQWWSEALHGVAYSPGVTFGGDTPVATSFPQVCLSAASFNASLWNLIGSAVSTEARAFSNANRAGLTFWAPNINIFRDPRWGRGQETPGEDPFLTSEYAKEFVTGMQLGSDPEYLKVSSCIKHYTAYDMEDSDGTNRDHFNAVVAPRDLADTIQPPFQAGVQLGGASAIMCSYNAVNGIPSCANHHLNTEVAREAWGFQGYMTSDCGAVSDVINAHHYTDTPGATVNATLSSGMDIDCGDYITTHLDAALQSHNVSVSTVKAALRHLFQVRIRLGVFDDEANQPYRRIPPAAVNTPAHQQLALEAAEQGIVMLKNTGVAPLPTSLGSVAVLGPNANASATQLGNYYGSAPYIRTIVDGIDQFGTVKYELGCNVSCIDTSGFAAAVSAAADADQVVLVVGLDQHQEAEGHDRTSLSLPGQQAALIDKVAAAAKGPIVLVVVSGSMVDVAAWVDDDAVGAIFWAGYGGQSAGSALANILFGKVNPSGRLSNTWYHAAYASEIDMTDMNFRPVDGKPGRTYRFYEGTPIFEFGTGMSYTTFQVEPVSSPQSITVADAAWSAGMQYPPLRQSLPALGTNAVNVTNTGSVAGTYTALHMVVPPGAGEDGNPIKNLAGFERVDLHPGQSKTVNFGITAFDLSLVDEAGVRRLVPGEYRFEVGAGSQEQPVTVARVRVG